jgi:hypothetical protein
MVDVKDFWVKRIVFVSKETGKELFDIGIMKDYSKDLKCPRVSDEKTYRFAVEEGLNPLDFQFLGKHKNTKNPLMAYPCNSCEQLVSNGVFNPESRDIMSVQRYECIKYNGKRIAVGLAKDEHVTFSNEQLEKLLEEKTSKLF